MIPWHKSEWEMRGEKEYQKGLVKKLDRKKKQGEVVQKEKKKRDKGPRGDGLAQD